MYKILAAFLIITFFGNSQEKTDSITIRKIYDEALSNGESYENLRSLCKDIGARLTGSAEAEMAIEWGKKKLENYGFDNVRLQEITVPHWERGNKEVAWYSGKDGALHKVKILALGGSIGTNGLMAGEVIEFKTFAEFKEVAPKKVKDKIVFLNQPMDEKQIQTFRAYGGCYPIRGKGTGLAGEKGAMAVIIRSLAIPNDDHPHTGSMHYDEGQRKIPGAAISTDACNEISAALKKGKVTFHLEMDCRQMEDKTSYNVIGEITGSEKPDEIITFGGHLDSWDVGEGAHDDGAGIAHCIEALRIFKALKIKPKHTLRVVLFMNEENGNFGGRSYASIVKKKGEKQIAALESDSGGFTPRGFTVDGSEEQVKLLQSFETLLSPYGLHIFEKGYGGVDIGPLKKEYENIPLFGFRPDSQRYFDFHHSEADVFENVNKRELELGCASIASFLFLLDKNI